MPKQSYYEQLSTQGDPRQAMLILAAGIDEILDRLSTPTKAPDPWDALRFVDGGENDTDALPEDILATGTAEEIFDALEEADAVGFSTPTPYEINVDRSSASTEVVIPPVNEERKIARRLFAEKILKLDSGVIVEGAPDGTTWSEVYSKGGPMWLYIYDREIVMSYPYNVRQIMVSDVEEDDPAAAAEMGRDVLKRDGETGPGGVAMGTDHGHREDIGRN